MAKITRKQQFRALRETLIRWYDRHRRDLPWRRTPDPYAVWISEIMLQQTRVEQAGPYFERFMKRFPDVRTLAGASRDEVLKIWEGMGYYTRARNLHEAARLLVAEGGGGLPETADELKKLPGIGPYTAGAVASIAFGKDEPLLDGNVIRVFCRLFAVGSDPGSARTRERLWSLARDSLPPGKGGIYNQALMDLGAVVCIPRKPRCEECPLREVCLAHARGSEEKYPMKPPKKTVPREIIVAGVIWKRGRILIGRRKPEGLLGGLWEFPGGKVEPGETREEALHREVEEEVGIKIGVDQSLVTVNHAYSHFRITLHAYACVHRSGRARALGCDAVKWTDPHDLDQFAFPAANKKIIAALRERR